MACMLESLLRLLYRHAQWRLITPLFLLCLGYAWLFNFSAFPYANPALVAIGCGQGLLDVLPHYDAAQAYHAFECYGVAGRSLYQHYLMVDATFAACYGLCFSLVMSVLVRANRAGGSAWRWLALLPLAIALADGAENVLLYRLLAAYPQQLPTLAGLAGMATSSKWLLSGLTSLLMLLGLLRLAWRRGYASTP